MDYVIAIPSYKRADQLPLKTLDVLQKSNISSDKIFVFVVQEELEDYIKSCPNSQIVPGILGLVEQRKFIESYFPLDTYIIFLDDDISEIYRSTSETTKEVIRNLDTLFTDMIQQMKDLDIVISGIYPCSNIKFSFNNPEITSNYRYIVGAFYIIKNLRDINLYPESDILEDRERTVLYWLKYKKILRFNHIFLKTKYFGKGGLESNDRLINHTNYSNLLVKKYPKYLRLKICKGFVDAKCRKFTL